MQLKYIVKDISHQQSERILREGALIDIRRIENDMLFESNVRKRMKLMTEQELREGFFDTVKNLGKNAIGSIKNAWANAKAQGDKDEMARLEKQAAAVKADAEKKGEAPAGGAAAGDKKQGDATDADKKAADTPESKEASAKAAEESILALLDSLKKNNPESYQKVVASLGKSPEAVEKMQATPEIKQEKEKVVDKISKPKDPKVKKQGLAAMVGNFVKSVTPTPLQVVSAIDAIKDATKASAKQISTIIAKAAPNIAKQAQAPQEVSDDVKKLIDGLSNEEKQMLVKML